MQLSRDAWKYWAKRRLQLVAISSFQEQKAQPEERDSKPQRQARPLVQQTVVGRQLVPATVLALRARHPRTQKRHVEKTKPISFPLSLALTKPTNG